MKKQIRGYGDRHISGRRNGLNSKKYKAYRLLYRTTAPSIETGSARRRPDEAPATV